MGSNTNGVSGPRAGLNAPSGVTRVLMTGFYDGATNGMLQFGDGGPVFRFDLADEAGDWYAHDERTFTLRPMPGDALERFAAAVAPHLTPRWPVWGPNWSFPSDDIERQADADVDLILADAGPPVWTITTANYSDFAAFRADPAAVEHGV